MKIANKLIVIYRNASRKLSVTLLMLVINLVTFYMIDVVGTEYLNSHIAIDGINNMFSENTGNIYYAKVVGDNAGYENNIKLSEYIKGLENVSYSGFMANNASTDLIEGECVYVVIADMRLINMGNLKLTEEMKEKILSCKHQNYQPLLLGSEYKGKANVGDVCTVSVYKENDAMVIGFLEEDAAWPRNGELFNNSSNGESYSMDGKGILFVSDYSQYDTSMTADYAQEYYYVVEDMHNDEVEDSILDYALENGMTVRITNIKEVIDDKIQDSGLKDNNEFYVVIIFILVSIFSLTAVSVIYILINQYNYAVLIVCGVQKKELTECLAINNTLIYLLPGMLVWFIRQYKLFGFLYMDNTSLQNNLLIYNQYTAHMKMLPVIICIILVVQLLTIIIPAIYIHRLSISDTLQGEGAS